MTRRKRRRRGGFPGLLVPGWRTLVLQRYCFGIYKRVLHKFHKAFCGGATMTRVLLVVALSHIAGLKYASMSVHTRETPVTSICERSDGSTWNGASRWGMASFDVLSCHRCASRVGVCGIERLHGEWLGWMWCAVSDVRLEWVLMESSV